MLGGGFALGPSATNFSQRAGRLSTNRLCKLQLGFQHDQRRGTNRQRGITHASLQQREESTSSPQEPPFRPSPGTQVEFSQPEVRSPPAEPPLPHIFLEIPAFFTVRTFHGAAHREAECSPRAHRRLGDSSSFLDCQALRCRIQRPVEFRSQTSSEFMTAGYPVSSASRARDAVPSHSCAEPLWSSRDGVFDGGTWRPWILRLWPVRDHISLI
jgi:hypothetical protein